MLQERIASLSQRDYVLAKEIVPYQEFDRRRKIWQAAELLNDLKEDVRANGFPIPVTLAIDLVSFRCNLHDGNHRMTSATKLNLIWILVRVLRLSLGLANNYLKVHKVPESFFNLRCPFKFRFTTFRDKEG